MLATTTISRGKYTFLMRLPLLISDSVETIIESLRNRNGMRPHSRKRTKLFSPLGSPIGGTTFRNSPNTIQ